MSILRRPEFWHDMDDDGEDFIVFDYEVGVLNLNSTKDNEEEFIFEGSMLARSFDDCLKRVKEDSYSSWSKERYLISILSITNTGRLVKNEP